jgi:hypothetical protein
MRIPALAGGGCGDSIGRPAGDIRSYRTGVGASPRGAVTNEMEDLHRLAGLIKQRNTIVQEIAALIGRPGLIGHIGEYIAAHVFHINLQESASYKGIDGHFTTGQLAGCSVNVKWYLKQEGLLDINPQALPDFYLVLTGPKASAGPSRGQIRPWLIHSVHLFDAAALVGLLKQRGLKIGVATSVRQKFWRESEIYPEQRSSRLTLTEEQRNLLALFQ